MVDVIKLETKNHQLTVDEIIEWIKGHNGDGNIQKMIVVIEDAEGEVRSRNVKVLNRDYTHYLLRELVSHINGEE